MMKKIIFISVFIILFNINNLVFSEPNYLLKDIISADETISIDKNYVEYQEHNFNVITKISPELNLSSKSRH
ncbi:MAG: hypothetical protein E7399_10145 [Ruminococcaceae bacterium]|nr:hypothetical protein [Oscillospiraceae bacterium]